LPDCPCFQGIDISDVYLLGAVLYHNAKKFKKNLEKI